MNPYQQGHLDALCGVYCLVNATSRVVGRLPENKAIELFEEAVKHLAAHPSTANFLVEGIGTGKLHRLFKTVFAPRYGLVCSCPFKNDKNKVPLDVFWSAVSAFINEGKGRAVIVGVETREWTHWTVVAEASAKRFILCDSAQRSVILKATAMTIWDGKRKPIRFHVEDTFFITRQ